jgi:hypothetical protein
MGNETCTVQNLKVIKIDTVHGLIYVKGGVPGVDNASFMPVIMQPLYDIKVSVSGSLVHCPINTTLSSILMQGFTNYDATLAPDLH